jgi:hypothetical protein
MKFAHSHLFWFAWPNLDFTLDLDNFSLNNYRTHPWQIVLFPLLIIRITSPGQENGDFYEIANSGKSD